MLAAAASLALARLPQALPDTIVTRTIAERGWLETLVSVEQAIVGILMLGMLVAIVLSLVAIRKGMQELSRLLQVSLGDISGAARSVRDVADDARLMARSLKSDVETISDTVRAVNGRVRDAVEAAEDKVRRFGDLVDTVQDEAEDLVDNAASAIRGVTSGATVLRRGLSLARWATARNARHARDGDEEADDYEGARPVRRRRRYRPRVRPRPHSRDA